VESCSLTPGRAPFPASTRRFFKSRASSFRSGRPRGVSLRGKSRCACNVDPGKGLRYAGKLVRWPTAQAQDARSGKPRCKRSPQLRGHGSITGFWFFVLFDLIALTARSARCRHLGGDASPFPRHIVFSGGWCAKHLRCGLVGSRQRVCYGIRGCALRRLWRKSLSVYGPPLGRRASDSHQAASNGIAERNRVCAPGVCKLDPSDEERGFLNRCAASLGSGHERHAGSPRRHGAFP